MLLHRASTSSGPRQLPRQSVRDRSAVLVAALLRAALELKLGSESTGVGGGVDSMSAG